MKAVECVWQVVNKQWKFLKVQTGWIEPLSCLPTFKVYMTDYVNPNKHGVAIIILCLRIQINLEQNI